MDLQKLMGYAAIFFGIIGSWGLYRQIKAIWGSRSAQSVSGTWTITFLAMFTAFLIYGFQKKSFPMEFQGVLRVVFSIPVTIGFFVFGKWRKKDVLLLIGCAILLVAMVDHRLSPTLFIAFSFLGVWASFVQAFTIYKEQKRGKIAVELQVIYLLAVICWLGYAITRHDLPLMTTSTGFSLSYLATIAMWLKYPGK